MELLKNGAIGGISIVNKLGLIFHEESKYLTIYKELHLKYRRKALPRLYKLINCKLYQNNDSLIW